ncbi:LOB domain-containing protein 13-like [Magnolia sinica]|uniref:LOB domain-containing protein 13-like n=1 Tax=Magnolia sinica TaxID=86752 RepID=UPI002657FEAD|nr:LOB domain-containing protein 13-like [Magnolia sinica]
MRMFSAIPITLFPLSFFHHLLSFLLSWLFLLSPRRGMDSKGDGSSSSIVGKGGGSSSGMDISGMIGQGGSGGSRSFSGNNNNNHACAVCRHQRRKCNANCPLAPYFPPNKTEQFQNVHRLFGVSNVMKILNSIEPHLWPQAIETIQFEADMRKKKPVEGCLGMIRNLMKQVDASTKELAMVNDQLYYSRQRDQQMQHHQQQQLYNMFEPSQLIPPMPPFGGYYYPPQPGAVDPAADEVYNIGQMKNLNLESAYLPPPQEYEDIKPFERMLPDAYHNKQALNDGEESSAESAIREPQPLNHFTDNKMKNEVGEFSLTDANRRKGKRRVDN